MNSRDPRFNPRQATRPRLDPSPHALTDDEIRHVYDRLQAGQSPTARVVRKLLRVYERDRALLGACRCAAGDLAETKGTTP